MSQTIPITIYRKFYHLMISKLLEDFKIQTLIYFRNIVLFLKIQWMKHLAKDFHHCII